ncbi:MAG: peptidylprolyl isomerase [Actinomycetota bacterium]
MGTDKRARQKANRQAKLEELERAERRDRVRQYSYMGAIIAVVLIGGLALWSFSSGDDSTEAADGSDVGTLEEALAEQAAAEGDDAESTDAPAAGEPLPCPEADGSSPQTLQFPAAPPECTDPTVTYLATFDTNLGTITAELDAATAPATVNNFVYLARYHYYDGTAFHRIISDFMIQGGDPTGNPPGTGGPGYTIDEEVPNAGEYQVGSLAMAKRTAPGTTGAQFFIVTGAAGEALPPQYSLFGQVTEGLDVVKSIEALPTDETDFPTEEIIVNSITITEA